MSKTTTETQNVITSEQNIDADGEFKVKITNTTTIITKNISIIHLDDLKKEEAPKDEIDDWYPHRYEVLYHVSGNYIEPYYCLMDVGGHNYVYESYDCHEFDIVQAEKDYTTVAFRRIDGEGGEWMCQ